jgi:hypothetical protein
MTTATEAARARGLGTVVGPLLASALLGAPVAAQTTFQARLSADTVDVGEVFELLVRVPVPAGSIVYFPDTVGTTEVLESHTPVRWNAELEPAGGAMLTLTYPVMAYGSGMVPVPGFDIFVSPSANANAGEPLPGGSAVGEWDDAPTRGAAYVRPLRVPRRGVWVPPVFTPEQVEAGLEPMPSADVVGSSWHWPSVVVGFFFIGMLAVVVVRIARASIGARALRGPDAARWTPETSRRHALDELDRLLEERLHARGRTHELYTRSSGVVRDYAERLNPEHGADLTSSELMARLGAPVGNGHASAPLRDQMRTAEVVKFGRLRPEGTEAETHLRSLRAWVEQSGASEGASW